MAYFKKLFVNRYRGIRALKIHELKGVNLVVGDNNCGKTSVLEALQLLRTSGNLANVYRVSRQRDSIAVSNANSVFDNFLCMFPREKNGELEISVSGICNDKKISFDLKGKKDRVMLDTKELSAKKLYAADIPSGEIEADVFDGNLRLVYGKEEKVNKISVNQYSSVTGTPSSVKDSFNIVYVAPFEHLRGSVINQIIKNDSYKQICVKALQLFDPDIEDIMIFKSDIGNRPVEYIRHKILGDMPISSYGDGIKKVLALANAIAQAADGILLIDEVETAIHKQYFDDILRFIVKACKTFKVQVFITTHSIEAIDGLLATQDYNEQNDYDDICVCTIKRASDVSYSRVLSGREVFENREAFGFEVRL
ncbi:MAG: AAA family ATPase [Lachnospiraceae bacterium]|nr:AAA family ATPase [Lachnospiraceae bacterium]